MRQAVRAVCESRCHSKGLLAAAQEVRNARKLRGHACHGLVPQAVLLLAELRGKVGQGLFAEQGIHKRLEGVRRLHEHAHEAVQRPDGRRQRRDETLS